MKTRSGFVSNSSSSSFVLFMDRLTPEQVEKIKNHADLGEQMGIQYAKDEYSGWSVDIEPPHIKLYTSMDNFDMAFFLEEIGVPDNAIIHRGD